jgi:hypothetical protein
MLPSSASQKQTDNLWLGLAQLLRAARDVFEVSYQVEQMRSGVIFVAQMPNDVWIVVVQYVDDATSTIKRVERAHKESPWIDMKLPEKVHWLLVVAAAVLECQSSCFYVQLAVVLGNVEWSPDLERKQWGKKEALIEMFSELQDLFGALIISAWLKFPTFALPSFEHARALAERHMNLMFLSLPIHDQERFLDFNRRFIEPISN